VGGRERGYQKTLPVAHSSTFGGEIARSAESPHLCHRRGRGAQDPGEGGGGPGEVVEPFVRERPKH
jgi:hypothetical protein